MFMHSVFWPWFAGLIILAGGLVRFARSSRGAQGLDRWIQLGPVFVAAPLAVFGAEHFVAARFIAQMVPVWIPARLFWAYFVGCALLAAAISFAVMRAVRWSATLLGVMFLLIVFMLHLPNALAHPGSRLAWTFALRETAFAGGAWAFASEMLGDSHGRIRVFMVTFGRCALASAVLFFGVEQMLHPEFTPGVPDVKLTPAWVPWHALWGYPAGGLLLLTGAALLFHIRPRMAAALIGAVMILLTLSLFLPILALTRDSTQLIDAINYVADTLMFGGTALLVAQAMPRHRAAA